jgi:exopolysaccharide biosynthesis polyprenyl glycosylphosphotransferase
MSATDVSPIAHGQAAVNDALADFAVVRLRHLEIVGDQAPWTSAAAENWAALLAQIPGQSAGRLLYVSLIKRWVDVAVSAIALVLLSPILLAALAAVRLDSPGPAIFRQRRIGRGGSSFTIYKLRTMTWAEQQPLRFFEGADGQMRHKIPNDPRVTRVGAFLRRVSLDELPQLVNVLRGEMSLIGPRPELPQIVDDYEPWQRQRHLVKPGLTGWWQVKGRSDLPMHEHTDLDLYYIEHLSLRFDLRIALLTVRAVFSGLGAF